MSLNWQETKEGRKKDRLGTNETAESGKNWRLIKTASTVQRSYVLQVASKMYILLKILHLVRGLECHIHHILWVAMFAGGRSLFLL